MNTSPRDQPFHCPGALECSSEAALATAAELMSPASVAVVTSLYHGAGNKASCKRQVWLVSPARLAIPSCVFTGYRLGGRAWSLAKECGAPAYMPSAEEVGGREGLLLAPL